MTKLITASLYFALEGLRVDLLLVTIIKQRTSTKCVTNGH